MRLLGLVLFFVVQHSYGQVGQWAGSNTVTGVLYRNGNIGINNLYLGKYGSNYQGKTNPLVLYSNESAPGIQDLLIFGSDNTDNSNYLNVNLLDGNLQLGPYLATPNALIQNNGKAFFNSIQLSGMPDAQQTIAATQLFTALKVINQEGSGSINTSVGIDFHHFNVPDYPNARIYEKESVDNGNAAGSLIFATRTSEINIANSKLEDRLVITNTGNVLIGKTAQINAAYKLDVEGDIRANKIVVNTNGADFVFEKGYALKPLTEVEQFIKAHQHLPEISSAANMQANGVSLGELNTKLLQKIEELTLYMIEQNKKLVEQNKKIEALTAENARQNQQFERLRSKEKSLCPSLI